MSQFHSKRKEGRGRGREKGGRERVGKERERKKERVGKRQTGKRPTGGNREWREERGTGKEGGGEME